MLQPANGMVKNIPRCLVSHFVVNKIITCYSILLTDRVKGLMLDNACMYLLAYLLLKSRSVIVTSIAFGLASE